VIDRLIQLARFSQWGLVATLLVSLRVNTAHADTVVQVPLPDLLDGRSVTTLTGGQLVRWTLPTDGGGLQNAFATAAVAAHQGAPIENALPDDGVFPANARHPEVVLHFSNDADATVPQAHLVEPLGSFSFAVPAATYSKFFLFFNGAAGGTTLTITLSYTDTTGTETATVPDYYADVSPTDPVIFNLASNLAKWDANNQINEANHHNITGVELNPMPDKILTGIQVDRAAEGNLVFWGATGIATSELAGSGGAGGTAGEGGASGEGGTAGVGGVAGVGGAAGNAGADSQTAGAAGTVNEAGSDAGGTNSAGGAAGETAVESGGSSEDATNDSGGGCWVANDSALHDRTRWLVLGIGCVVGLNRRRSRGAASAPG
jgi:hypothetical protein